MFSSRDDKIIISFNSLPSNLIVLLGACHEHLTVRCHWGGGPCFGGLLVPVNCRIHKRLNWNWKHLAFSDKIKLEFA